MRGSPGEPVGRQQNEQALLHAALAAPGRITHLVLAATSGGVPMAEHGAEDWRQAFRLAYPWLPDWFATADVDVIAPLIDRHLSLA